VAFSVPVAPTWVRILLAEGDAGVGDAAAAAAAGGAISAGFAGSGIGLFIGSGIGLCAGFGASFFAGGFVARAGAFLSFSLSFSLTAARFVGALRALGFVFASAGAFVFVSSAAGFFAGRPRFLTAGGGGGGVDIAGRAIGR